LGLQVVDPVRQIRYPSLASTVIAQRLKQQALAEELRVLYVAMTRAKEHLIMIGSCIEKQSLDWIAQWSGHTGALPARAVLNARTPLDWLGPVAGLLPDQIHVQLHTPEEIAAWASGHSGKQELTAEQIALANRQPITPPPAMTADVQAVINRMTEQYPHAEVAHLAAAASVTSLVKKTATPSSSTPLPSGVLDRVLQHPQFLAGTLPLDAADKGTATHAVLEHFDFSQHPDSLDAQIQQMISTHRLTPELAATVDSDTLRWFLNSDIGQLIRDNANHLHRELPVYCANPSETTQSTDPMDQQMVRGRIDLLVPTTGGWMIVDYKTDRVEGAALDERAELYAGQLDIYRKAVQQITGKPVVESALVFLTARKIHKV
jgi:ATP-dependent helicase/nuclease subunit A